MPDVKFILWDRAAMRVVGHGGVDPANWDAHARHLASRGLEMAPVFAAAQLDELRQHGPQNFRVAEDYRLELLPPQQRNLTPIVIDNTDDGIAALNRKMDTLIDLMRPIAVALGKL